MSTPTRSSPRLKKPSLAASTQLKDPSSSTSSTHIRFSDSEQPIAGQNDPEDEKDKPNNLGRQHHESGSKPVSNPDDSGSSDSDSDDAPEVLSTAVSKREVQKTQDALKEFEKATALARRQANRIRDQRLQQNSKQRKSAPTPDFVDSTQGSSSEPGEPSSSAKAILPPRQLNNKKYLDPSLFASASETLDNSKKVSQARQAEAVASQASKEKKHRKRQDDQDRRELGNNTTVVHLSKTDHMNPAPRPVAATNFVRNRLITNPKRSSINLPKETLRAKAELGTRHSALSAAVRRKGLKPALVFARP